MAHRPASPMHPTSQHQSTVYRHQLSHGHTPILLLMVIQHQRSNKMHLKTSILQNIKCIEVPKIPEKWSPHVTSTNGPKIPEKSPWCPGDWDPLGSPQLAPLAPPRLDRPRRRQRPLGAPSGAPAARVRARQRRGTGSARLGGDRRREDDAALADHQPGRGGVRTWW